ncbi:MAG: phosphodiester glycosidase family protein [Bacilli bacterium]|nr:phosphodiester glycosidase family protein [Bacilli bacterium]
MKLFKKKYIFGITYGILLVGFTVFVLCDTFFIPKIGVVVESNSTITDNTNDEETTSDEITEETEETVITDTSYTDSNISININTIREYDTDIYVVDITLSSIDYLKTSFASNIYGRNITATTSSIAESNNAILAINGDYYGFRTKGFVLRNGVIYRSTSYGNDNLVIYDDGSFGIASEDTDNLSDLLSNGALQVFSFGPALINDGEIVVDANTEVDMAKSSNPRTAIGMIDPLHYVIIVSDGRTSLSEGLTLFELAEIFDSLGCTVAYNLDGGGSSTLYFNGNIINNPTDGNSSGERKVSDIIYVGY